MLLFGSASSPTIWGRMAAWIGHSMASLFSPDVYRAQIYVDDPLVTVAGTLGERSHMLAVTLAWLSLIGIPLSWSKVHINNRVEWIGAVISSDHLCSTISIPPAKVQDLRQELLKLKRMHVVSVKALLSTAGKVNFVAGCIVQLRPFLRCLWGAFGQA